MSRGQTRKEFLSGGVKIQVSKIRQWVLVAVYTEKIVLNKHINLYVPKRTLLRPPLFGRSDRFTTWEEYLSLCQFEDNVAEAWKKTTEGKLDRQRRHEEQWYVLGRHDLIYTLIDIDRKINGEAVKVKIGVELALNPYEAENWAVAKRAQELELLGTNPNQVGILRRNAAKRKLPPRLAEKEETVRIRFPYDYVSVPVSQRRVGKNRPGVDLPPSKGPEPREEPILLASDSVCRAYEMLSEIWNDSTAKSVLLIAPPGSGKELLARSIHHFQNIDGPYVTYALSPSSHERNDQTLFGRDLRTIFEPGWNQLLARAKNQGQNIAGSIVETNTRLLKIFVETVKWIESGDEPTLRQKGIWASKGNTEGDISEPDDFVSDGLLFKARKGALFLDEIDKVPEQTRASLLRLLENDEFALYGTSMVVRLENWRPLYVFAGSMPREQMLQLKPFDFWTRISHIIEMEHPLDVDDAAERLRVAKSYFAFFWVQHIEKFFKGATLLPFRFDKKLKHYFQDYYINLFTFLNHYEVVDRIAGMFAEEIETGAGSSRFSVRNIRGIVARVIYGLVDYLLYDNNQDSALSAIRNDVIKPDKVIKEYGIENPAKIEMAVSWFKLLDRVLITPKSAEDRDGNTDGSENADGHGGDRNNGDNKGEDERGDDESKFDRIVVVIDLLHGEKFREEIRHIVRAAIRKIYI